MAIKGWILYADHLLDPIWRSQIGSYMPIRDKNHLIHELLPHNWKPRT